MPGKAKSRRRFSATDQAEQATTPNSINSNVVAGTTAKPQ
jgi:hypothetical protein